jgi:hypothetical protein
MMRYVITLLTFGSFFVFVGCTPAGGTVVTIEPRAGVLDTAVPPSITTSTPTPAITPSPTFDFMSITPQATQTVPAQYAEFEYALQSILPQRYWPFVQSTIGPGEMAFGYFGSEWQTLSPEMFIQELSTNLIPPGAEVQFSPPDVDIAAMLEYSAPETMLGPDHNVAAILHSTGWGADGLGEALLFIEQTTDGQHFWRGTIYAPQGFPTPQS